MIRTMGGFLLVMGGAGTIDLGGSLLIGVAVMLTGLAIMNWGVKNLDRRF